MKHCEENIFNNKSEPKRVVIDGVGDDAEIVTNANGGRQSKSPAALHLVDPTFLYNLTEKSRLFERQEYRTEEKELTTLFQIMAFMTKADKEELIDAVFWLGDGLSSLFIIGKRMQFGVEKGYEANNWRLIPQEEHINHALIHLISLLSGDTQDNHKAACLCRLHMAYATKRSKNFEYTHHASEMTKEVGD